MPDTDPKGGAPSAEPIPTPRPEADTAVADAAKKAQADEGRDEGAGRASVPIDETTTANDK